MSSRRLYLTPSMEDYRYATFNQDGIPPYLPYAKEKRQTNEQSWEVVGCECIDPVPMIDDGDELDILRVTDTDTCGTYIFDLGKRSPQGSDYCRAVLFARQQLFQEIVKNGYNMLLLEGWTLTLYRKGKSHRIEVQYAGRPAYVSGKAPPFHPPPFMAVLESQHLFS
ncbi:uncharacterized protein HD556DRAFT_1428269 [Suillus plorans]|uniref:Uncharacterized protein n=1 Tax=Suillus plorans TaxID=116603 RepID=A0A9P7J9U4_9AGAM|nr:uncharacterized protein HD556DRAFT_1428269 [Suillus plorans]KAG1810110.1 hypothetical protein HD556DRAFT_1428269 [Suillus plorans]